MPEVRASRSVRDDDEETIAMRFEKNMTADWSDMDSNSHMRNTAFLEKAANVRLHFYAREGLPVSEFRRLAIGPVILRDEVEYFRELLLLDNFTVTFCLAGLSPDGSRLILRNDILAGNRLSARITSLSGWLDLRLRRLVKPPEEVLARISRLERSEDFRELSNIERP